MKNRKSYYVNRQNPLVWLSAVLIAAACVWSIFLYGDGHGKGFWFGIILPIVSAVWYILALFLGSKKLIHKIAAPASLFMMTLALGMFGHGRSYPVGYVAMYLLISVMLFETISGWVLGRKWIFGFFLMPIIALILEMNLANREVVAVLPEIFLFSGLLMFALSLRRRPDDGTYYPTWGDRSDGRRVRTVPPMTALIPFIMKNRIGASNLIRDSFESSKVDAYIRRKRKEGLTGFGITHVILATYVRTIAQYPGLNRFLSGQRIYSRMDDIQVNMVIKKEMSATSPDTAVKMFFKPDFTAEDVYNEIQRNYAIAKSAKSDSSVDKMMDIFNILPRFLMRGAVSLMSFLDYFGLLPVALTKLSPFHGSLFITSMASLGIPPIYHHLYDFGNVPVFIAFGIKRRENEVADGGRIVRRQYVDYTVVTDERICDGFYYASSLKYMKKIFANPDVLDLPPERVMADID